MVAVLLRQLLTEIPFRYHKFILWRLQPRGGRIDTYFEIGRDYIPICIYSWEWGPGITLCSEIRGKGLRRLKPFLDLPVTQISRVGCTL